MTRLAVTVGDPAGIGPEIILKAAPKFAGRRDLELLVVAPRASIDAAAKWLGGDCWTRWQAGSDACGFDASWEIDLFGGVRREIEAAEADLSASEDTLRDTLVTLQGEVARNYIEYRGLRCVSTLPGRRSRSGSKMSRSRRPGRGQVLSASSTWLEPVASLPVRNPGFPLLRSSLDRAYIAWGSSLDRNR